MSECENLVLLERRPLWMLHVWEELDEIFRLPLPTVIGPTRTNYPTNRPVTEFLVFF